MEVKVFYNETEIPTELFKQYFSSFLSASNRLFMVPIPRENAQKPIMKIAKVSNIVIDEVGMKLYLA